MVLTASAAVSIQRVNTFILDATSNGEKNENGQTNTDADVEVFDVVVRGGGCRRITVARDARIHTHSHSELRAERSRDAEGNLSPFLIVCYPHLPLCGVGAAAHCTRWHTMVCGCVPVVAIYR